MRPFSRSPAAFLLICLLFVPSDALVPLPAVRIGGIRRSGTIDRRRALCTDGFHKSKPSRRALVGPRNVRASDDGKEQEYSIVRRFLMSLSKGIFFAFPMRVSANNRAVLSKELPGVDTFSLLLSQVLLRPCLASKGNERTKPRILRHHPRRYPLRFVNAFWPLVFTFCLESVSIRYSWNIGRLWMPSTFP